MEEEVILELKYGNHKCGTSSSRTSQDFFVCLKNHDCFPRMN